MQIIELVFSRLIYANELIKISILINVNVTADVSHLHFVYEIYKSEI